MANWTFVCQPFAGPDIKFFAETGVRGVFEEGPGLAEGDGSDLEELKDYVMAELLWDPSLDPDQVIDIRCLYM